MGLQSEINKARPFDLPEQEAFLGLIRTAGALHADFERLFRSKGISAAAYNVLRILRGSGDKGRKSLEIGRDMVAQVPDITRLVDRLEEAGFVTRRRCEDDRRVVHVVITRAGLSLLGRLDEPVLALHEGQLGHMSREELRTLIALLEKARTPKGAGVAKESRRRRAPTAREGRTRKEQA